MFYEYIYILKTLLQNIFDSKKKIKAATVDGLEHKLTLCKHGKLTLNSQNMFSFVVTTTKFFFTFMVYCILSSATNNCEEPRPSSDVY